MPVVDDYEQAFFELSFDIVKSKKTNTCEVNVSVGITEPTLVDIWLSDRRGLYPHIPPVIFETVESEGEVLEKYPSGKMLRCITKDDGTLKLRITSNHKVHYFVAAAVVGLVEFSEQIKTEDYGE